MFLHSFRVPPRGWSLSAVWPPRFGSGWSPASSLPPRIGSEPKERARKSAFIAQIPPVSSVVAPLSYLSHLAMREKLYSLHYVLKGLKTLGRSSYQPPSPTDFVLIDYSDSATFDPGAGFYHPTMKTVDGRIIPSSDRLLHDFLKKAAWTADEQDELTLLRNLGSRKAPVGEQSSPADNE